jgi:hypothetical protein
MVNSSAADSGLTNEPVSLPLDFSRFSGDGIHCRRNISTDVSHLYRALRLQNIIAVGFLRCKDIINNLHAVFGLLEPLH